MARKPALAVVGAACPIYGIAATACSGGHAHFLVASVMPGALLWGLLLEALLRRGRRLSS